VTAQNCPAAHGDTLKEIEARRCRYPIPWLEIVEPGSGEEAASTNERLNNQALVSLINCPFSMDL